MSMLRPKGKRNRNVQAAVLAATAVLTGLGSRTEAVQYIWDGNAGGGDLFFDTPTNWTATDGTIPDDVGDEVRFTSSSPAPSIINLRRNETAGWAGTSTTGRNVTFNLNGFQLDFTSTNISTFDHSGSSSNTIEFAGNGTTTETPTHGGIVSFAGQLRITFAGGATPAQKTTILVSNGADLNTPGGISVGDYRSPGALVVTGAGSRINNTGDLQTNRGANFNYGSSFNPRSEIQILDGGVLNQDGSKLVYLGNTGSTSGSLGSGNTTRVQVDGAGSQFNILTTSDVGTARWASGDRVVTLDVSNGGLIHMATNLIGKFDNTGTGSVTYNITGDGSKVSALGASIGGASTDTGGITGATIVNLGAGSILEARGRDGSERSVAIFDASKLSMQGGTVQMTSVAPGGSNNLVLRNLTALKKARLEGFGTITGGNVIAEQDSVISVASGALKITDGNLTTAGGATPTDVAMSLQTTSGNVHGLIALSNPTSTATIGDNATNAITFSVEGGGNLAAGGEGFLDFLIAGNINYGGTLLLDDVPDIDNLDNLMADAGYTRVDAAVTPDEGEYRYFLTTVGLTDYEGGEYAGQQALRLEMEPAPVPEPGSLALLGLGASLLMRRRRRA